MKYRLPFALHASVITLLASGCVPDANPIASDDSDAGSSSDPTASGTGGDSGPHNTGNGTDDDIDDDAGGSLPDDGGGGAGPGSGGNGGSAAMASAGASAVASQAGAGGRESNDPPVAGAGGTPAGTSTAGAGGDSIGGRFSSGGAGGEAGASFGGEGGASFGGEGGASASGGIDGFGGSPEGGAAGASAGGSGGTQAGGTGGSTGGTTALGGNGGSNAGTGGDVAGGGGQGGSDGDPCEFGFRDCNGFSIDGCEQYVQNDNDTCGDCDTSCADGAMCLEGACTPPLTLELVYTTPKQGAERLHCQNGGKECNLGAPPILVLPASAAPHIGFSVYNGGVTGPSGNAAGSFVMRREGDDDWVEVDDVGPTEPDTIVLADDFRHMFMAEVTPGSFCYVFPDAYLGNDEFDLLWSCGTETPVPWVAQVPGSYPTPFGATFDPSGQPVVAYGAWSDLRARYGSNDDLVDTDVESLVAGSGWVESPGIDLAQASTGEIHIVYLQSDQNLRHAVWGGVDWALDDVDPADGNAFPAIATDPDGNPVIAYFSNVDETLWLARPGDTDWDIEYVAESPQVSGLDLLVDDEGAIHLVYTDEDGWLWYLVRNDEGWSQASIDIVFPGLGRPNLKLDDQGQPHIAVGDFANESVYYGFFASLP